VTNWTASIGEDLLVIGGLWTALNYPWLFLAALLLFIVLLAWLLPKLIRAIASVFRRLGAWLRGEHPGPAAPPPPAPVGDERLPGPPSGG
jgi:hypothetical protein